MGSTDRLNAACSGRDAVRRHSAVSSGSDVAVRVASVATGQGSAQAKARELLILVWYSRNGQRADVIRLSHVATLATDDQ